jgi:hypothetical protein
MHVVATWGDGSRFAGARSHGVPAARCWTGSAKLAVLEGFRNGRDSLGWSATRVCKLPWISSGPTCGLDKGLATPDWPPRGSSRSVLVDRGCRCARRWTQAPTDTRAYFRGECLRRFPDDVVAASLGFGDLRPRRCGPLQRVPMLEPLRGSKADVGGGCDSGPTVQRNCRRATGRPGSGAGQVLWRLGSSSLTASDEGAPMAGQEQIKPQRRDDGGPDDDLPSDASGGQERRDQHAARSTTCSTRSTGCWSPTPRSSCAVSSRRAASDLRRLTVARLPTAYLLTPVLSSFTEFLRPTHLSLLPAGRLACRALGRRRSTPRTARPSWR